MAQLDVADYLLFAASLLLSMLVGVYYYWQEKRHDKKAALKHHTTGEDMAAGRTTLMTAERYFLADRNLSFWPTTVSLFASYMSAIALVAIPAEIYMNGGPFMIGYFGIFIGIILAATLVVPVLYRLRLLSAFTYIELRFGSKILRLVTAISGICCTIAYLAGVTMTPCMALEAVTPIPMWLSVVVTSFVTILYSALGGMRAIVMVDFIQAFFMFAGIIATLIIGFAKIDGGISEVFKVSADNGRFEVFNWNPDPRQGYTVYAMSLPLILSNMGLYGTSQGAVQRYCGLRTEKMAKWSVIAMIPIILLLSIVLVLFALLMYAHYEILGCDPLANGQLDSPNQLTTFYITEVITPTVPGLAGLWFAALFSGSLSTMSTGFNGIAAIIWDDILKDLPSLEPITSKYSGVIHRAVSVITGFLVLIFAILFKFIPGSAIVLLLSTATIFECAAYVPYFCGLFMPFANTFGVTTGTLGAMAVIGTMSLGRLFGYGRDLVQPLPTTVEFCEATNATNFANLTTTTTRLEIDYSWLPQDIFSISPFFYPFFEIFLGVCLSAIVSLLAGGWQSRGNVPQKTLFSFSKHK